MLKPKISVIMPCLNSAGYITEAIDSVLSQSFSDFEFIIVDAGSTDGTIDIIKSFASSDSRIVYLHSDLKSMGKQYNLGIESAKGDYLCFIESDDYIRSNMLERLHETIVKHSADYVRADFTFFADTENERVFLQHKVLDDQHASCYNIVMNDIRNPSFIFTDVQMWNGIYKKAFINDHAIRLNETAGAAFQDCGFVLQTIMFAKRAVYLDEPFYCYRQDNVASSFYSKSLHIFAVNEYLFIRKRFNECSRDVELIIPYIIRRFFGMFANFVGDYLIYGKDVGLEKVIHELIEFQRAIKSDYESIGEALLSFSGIYPPMGLEGFFTDIGQYATLRSIERERYFSHYAQFADFMKSKETVVICGAGKNGQLLYVLLRLCGIKNIIIADNDSNKFGRVLGSEKVIPVKESISDNQFYLISVADVTLALEIRAQLIDNGVPKESIMKFCLPIDDFQSFQLPHKLSIFRDLNGDFGDGSTAMEREG